MWLFFHIWAQAIKFIYLCFIIAVNKNDKADNKMGEAKKPKTTGNKTQRCSLSAVVYW